MHGIGTALMHYLLCAIECRQVSLLEEELQGMRGEHSQAMREVVAYRQSQDRMSADGQQKAALLSATNAELLQVLWGQ